MNKKAMYKLSYGLFVLTAKDARKTMGALSIRQFRQRRNQIN